MAAICLFVPSVDPEVQVQTLSVLRGWDSGVLGGGWAALQPVGGIPLLLLASARQALVVELASTPGPPQSPSSNLTGLDCSHLKFPTSSIFLELNKKLPSSFRVPLFVAALPQGNGEVTGGVWLLQTHLELLPPACRRVGGWLPFPPPLPSSTPSPLLPLHPKTSPHISDCVGCGAVEGGSRVPGQQCWGHWEEDLSPLLLGSV